MKRLQVLVASIVVVGVFGVRAWSRDDDASTTTTTSAATPGGAANAALVTPTGAVLRRHAVDTDVYHAEREPVGSDNAMTTTTPTAPRATAAETSAAVTPTAQRKGEASTTPSPVGPGGFAAGPLDTAGAFVPGPLDTARGFGPARVDPSSAFTAAPLDTGFRGPGGVDNDQTSGAMRPSGASNPNTTSGAAPRP